jgi:uncharacterized RDD family membrane protein YckC
MAADTPAPDHHPSPLPSPGTTVAAGAGRPASWGQRAAAYLIDAFAPAIAAYVVVGVLGAVSSTLGTLLGLLAPLALLGWLVYDYGVLQGRTGYSLGKGIVGIRLVDAATGRPVGTGMAVARWFVHIVDALPCYLGYLWPLWDARRETFADKILKHAVVTAPKVDPRTLLPGPAR